MVSVTRTFHPSWLSQCNCRHPCLPPSAAPSPTAPTATRTAVYTRASENFSIWESPFKASIHRSRSWSVQGVSWFLFWAQNLPERLATLEQQWRSWRLQQRANQSSSRAWWAITWWKNSTQATAGESLTYSSTCCSWSRTTATVNDPCQYTPYHPRLKWGPQLAVLRITTSNNTYQVKQPECLTDTRGFKP